MKDLKAVGILTLLIFLLLLIIFVLIVSMGFTPTLSLGLMSYFITVTSGMSTIKKFSVIKSKRHQPIDIWMILGIAVTVSGVLGIILFGERDNPERTPYLVLSAMLFVLSLVSVLLNYRKNNKESNTRKITRESYSLFRENDDTITITTVIKKSP